MKTLHNVIILDRSGSMAGAKYEAATSGIRREMEEIKKQAGDLYITQSIYEFNGIDEPNITQHCFMLPLANYRDVIFKGAEGGTPLYRTVEYVIKSLLGYKNKEEQVLLKIFTDGQDTTSYNPASLKSLINNVEELHNFTVTFEGTKFDGNKVHEDIGITLDNMVFHDNSVDSIQKSGLTRSKATISYMSDLSSGANMKDRGFYKDIKDED